MPEPIRGVFEPPSNFDTALARFLERAQAIIDEYYARNYERVPAYPPRSSSRNPESATCAWSAATP